MSDEAAIPDGFRALNRGGPFIALFGPLYYKLHDGKIVVGLRIEDRHLNIRSIAHGGLLATLADSALGIALSGSQSPPQPMVTVNLSIDFVDAANRGDWVEAHVDIQRVGKRLAFANCYLQVEGRRILRASGVFALMPPVAAQEKFEG